MDKHDEAIKMYYFIVVYLAVRYDVVLKIDPKNSNAWNNKGNSCFSNENYKEALIWYNCNI